MVLKLDSPLFGDTARGTIRGFGTFRTTTAGTHLVTNARGNRTSVGATTNLRACFASAKAAHAALPLTWTKIGGRWHGRRVPDWPAFWLQWLIDNPGCKL